MENGITTDRKQSSFTFLRLHPVTADGFIFNQFTEVISENSLSAMQYLQIKENSPSFIQNCFKN